MVPLLTFLLTRRLLVSVCVIVMGLSFSACSKPAAVKWPELRAMDELAEKAEGWVETNNVPELRKVLPEVRTTATKLVSSGVPANAREPKQVEQTLGDLRSLLQPLEKAELSDEELKTQISALHPLVEKLMEQSGVPHVHGHDHDDGHEH